MPSISHPITYKTDADLKKMEEGGKKLAEVKEEVRNIVRDGTNAQQIEDLATKLVDKAGGEPSFKMVPGYSWTTCVNVNSGLVHGIPKETIIFKKDDLVSVDLGMYYKGFHTDTSFSEVIGNDPELSDFLRVGEKALENAIKEAVCGNRIFDISAAIEKTIVEANFRPIKALVGHGVGKNLHEEPEIPCFRQWKKEATPEILPGMTLAIEVMYAKGSGDIEISDDGWTISTRDGKISALFEETVAVTKERTKILTA
ncbi:type I methionyl aminopeptidase [Candidatus Woesebacteria bacterium RBG_16_36_11]|uniref:Methionine aminopeptidase n=3 Tax=Candidatus Woeseibacteriota TaxID=1752722 RepID=A0A1F7XDF3_9BACT|nr:MAG: type I methionyl aminopeptidase [Candidatus Woesebacteria bacterium RBG_13_36_22]OGM12355.1 MAG: type I methionyl aminopeptidase [Candidatus Woesebacteria bacterium RBG_16_36_11]OGM17226.1 MAG: type I methionyl aminopeptidase [Candidatus Woesebacteria bacterium RBG_19FT_COMBO_37_29]